MRTTTGTTLAGLACATTRRLPVSATDLPARQLVVVPRTWPEFADQLQALAPRVSFQAAEVEADGRCRPVYGIAPTTARPIGSVFKLYVLGALAHAVAAGRASWDERLAVRAAWKADLQSTVGVTPDGTMLTLRRYADEMIYQSDNSATDHLVGRLGRGAIEAQLVRFGSMHIGANLPFLTVREFTQLKAVDYPRLADRYATGTVAQRRAILRDELADLPPLGGRSWSQPRRIDSIEWFASAADLCRTFAGLIQQDRTDRVVGSVLARNDPAALGLDPRHWKASWSKDGYEPGVLTQTVAARTAAGRTFVVAVLLSNGGTITDDQTDWALTAVAAAFRLLAR